VQGVAGSNPVYSTWLKAKILSALKNITLLADGCIKDKE
jgi:hypothetical protein